MLINLIVEIMTLDTWHTLASFCFSSTDSKFSILTNYFHQFSWPRKVKWDGFTLHSHVSSVWPQQGESDVFLVRGLSVSSAWLAWQHTPGLWLAETRSRDQDPGILLDDEARHRSRQTGRMKAAAADVFSQCDFGPVTFKWHGPCDETLKLLRLSLKTS